MRTLEIDTIKRGLSSYYYGCDVEEKEFIYIVTIELFNEEFDLPFALCDFILAFSVNKNKITIYLKKELLE